MSQASDIIKGLQIMEDKGDTWVSAEHDEIYAGTVENYTAEEISELEALGWNVSEYESFRIFV